jgi:hypothetical protein
MTPELLLTKAQQDEWLARTLGLVSVEELRADLDEWIPLHGTFVQRGWLLRYWTHIAEVPRA